MAAHAARQGRFNHLPDGAAQMLRDEIMQRAVYDLGRFLSSSPVREERGGAAGRGEDAVLGGAPLTDGRWNWFVLRHDAEEQARVMFGRAYGRMIEEFNRRRGGQEQGVKTE